MRHFVPPRSRTQQSSPKLHRAGTDDDRDPDRVGAETKRCMSRVAEGANLTVVEGVAQLEEQQPLKNWSLFRETELKQWTGLYR